MARDDLPLYVSGSYVLPQYKVAYVATPKAACSSMKWMLAELAGEDLDAFRRSTAPVVTRSLTIHKRALWSQTPTLRDFTARQRSQMTAENGWFTFAVVRQPASRLWSAWQSKLLLGEPRYHRQWEDESFLPRVPQTTADVVEDFRRFALGLPDGISARALTDRHFQSQAAILRPDVVPYRTVYRTSQIPQLMSELGAHVAAQGGPALPALTTSNETPLKAHADAFDDEVLAAIGRTYADDLAAFGFDELKPKGLLTDDYPDTLLQEVGRLVERSQRIGDLAQTAAMLERRLEKQQGAGSTQGGGRAKGAGRRTGGAGRRTAPAGKGESLKRAVKRGARSAQDAASGLKR